MAALKAYYDFFMKSMSLSNVYLILITSKGKIWSCTISKIYFTITRKFNQNLMDKQKNRWAGRLKSPKDFPCNPAK